jgi:hypothetical protein
MKTISILSFVVAFNCVGLSLSYAAPSSRVPKFICSKNSTGALFLRTKCKSGETKIANRSSLVGPEGPTGAAGVNGSNGTNGANGTNGTNGSDGQLRIYGNGSQGEIDTTGDLDLYATFPTLSQLQLTDIRINAGHTFSVPAGTILRATGSVTIDGTLRILAGNRGGIIDTFNGSLVAGQIPAFVPPSPGISSRAAGIGELGSNTAERFGGERGAIATDAVIRSVKDIALLGGGGGASGILGGLGAGGTGGGGVMIIAQGAITINGTGLVTANGSSGGTGAGGGAGGVIIVASATSITQNGTFRANGGNGGGAGGLAASGGGGSGGVVHFIASTVSPAGGGTVEMTGGTGGSTAAPGTISNTMRYGGGGGGACGGNGGFGAVADTDGSSTNGSSGAVGKLFVLQADPTALF